MRIKKIREIPPFDRPREKLATQGPEALSDVELLAVLIGSGVKDKTVFQIANNVLRTIDHHRKTFDVSNLCDVEGVGFAKACQIVAAFEFARRRLNKNLPVVQNAKDALPLVAYIANKKQEYFLCISLNGANEMIGNRVVTVGLLNSTMVHPREVFADVISDRAASVIIAHNHPSGKLTPSPEDIALTKQMVEAGRMLGIAVLDHLIITQKGYLSLKQEGYI